MQYSKKVMEKFLHPKFLGEIKDADGKGKIGNPVCLVPSTKVHMDFGLKGIENIDLNDKVLSHDGKYNKVIKIFKQRYSGKIVKIKNRLGTTVITPEHEVLAVKVPKTDKFFRFKSKKKLEFDWYPAGELEKKDLTVFPILKEEKDIKQIKTPQEKKKYDFKSKDIPSKIYVDKDFLRLSGYYLSEGNLSEKVTKTYLGFTFNIKEEKLARDVVCLTKRIFGIDAIIKKRKEHNTQIVLVNNVFIVRLFKTLFGKGADKKSIPGWMISLPIEKQKSLLYGLWKGDGFFNPKKRAGYSTISYLLSQQIKVLLLRQKIIPSIYTENEKVRNGTRHKKAYRIHVGDRGSLKTLAKILKEKLDVNKPIAVGSWIKGDLLFTPITDFSKTQHSGFVYNLEVQDSKSFSTESLAVHNCGDMMEVFIKVARNKDGEEYIKDIKVKTFGCVAAISSSEVMCEIVKGKTLAEAEEISNKAILKELGEVPPQKVHCSVLAADALRNAIKDYKS